VGGKNGLRPKLPRLMPVRYREDFASVMDGRSRLARELRDRLSALVADLGGEDALSHAQRSLCQRAVWLELCIEHEETRIAEGGGIDIAPHAQLVGTLLSIFKTLGLKRQPRPTPSLRDYLTKGESP
jgi:hypothetical protein